MIAIFKQKSPVNIILVLIFGLLLKLPLFIHPKIIVVPQNDGKLYSSLVAWIGGASGSMIGSIIAFVLLYIQALLLNFLINEYRMTSKQTFLPAMAYMLLTSLLPDWSYLSAPLVASTFIILMYITLFNLYNASNANGKIYNIGLLTGICSFIFFPSVFFSVSIILGIMVLRPLRLNEIVLFLMGVATPYYFYAVYLFLTDQLRPDSLLPVLYVHLPAVKRSLWLVGSTLLLTVPFLIGGYSVQAGMRKMLIQARKNWSILLLYLLLSFFVPFVNSTDSFHPWVVMAVPFATFHASAYLNPPRKWLAHFLFFVMLAFILAQQYVPNVWKGPQSTVDGPQDRAVEVVSPQASVVR